MHRTTERDKLNAETGSRVFAEGPTPFTATSSVFRGSSHPYFLLPASFAQAARPLAGGSPLVARTSKRPNLRLSRSAQTNWPGNTRSRHGLLQLIPLALMAAGTLGLVVTRAGTL